MPDASDFRLVAHASPPPDWALGAVVYQIFPDRFARSAQADKHATPGLGDPGGVGRPGRRQPQARAAHQLYGGDLDGITEHLDHLESLGVDVVYLTPFFPARVQPPLRRVDLRAGRPAARRRRRRCAG